MYKYLNIQQHIETLKQMLSQDIFLIFKAYEFFTIIRMLIGSPEKSSPLLILHDLFPSAPDHQFYLILCNKRVF